MSLNGKNIFITGGSGGIGRPLVELLEQSGAKVTVFDRSRDGNLTENLDRVCGGLLLETPDILINMAGINSFSYCEEQPYKDLIDLNLLVPMRLTQAVLPGMKSRGQGQIVTVGSMAALIPLPHLTGYVATKAGLKGFTDALRRELSGTAIVVTHVVPRAVKTEMNTGKLAEVNQRTGTRHDDPEMIAKTIFSAIIKGKKEVRIGWPERLFAFLHANIPTVVDRGLQKNRRIGEEILSHHIGEKDNENEKNIDNCHPVA
jgi:short-subunit dehydrogenase